MKWTPARSAFVLAALFVLAACGDSEERGQVPSGSEAEQAREQEMPGMEGMPGMENMQGGMMAQMQVHMRMMQGASADSTMALLPMHRQMLANMISQMNREMDQMNMEADAAWNATVDSLRQDLIRMPEMNAQELQSFMPEHHARVARLMEMHGDMMESM